MDTTPNPQPAKLQASVNYLPGISIVGATSALLEWSADDRLKLFLMDNQTHQATEVLFDVPVAEVQNVGGNTIMLVITVANQKYNVQFSTTAMAKMVTGGVIGVAWSARDMKKTGIYSWVEAFKANNIPMKGYKGWNWSMKLALIITGVIFAGLLVYVVVLVATGGVQPDTP